MTARNTAQLAVAAEGTSSDQRLRARDQLRAFYKITTPQTPPAPASPTRHSSKSKTKSKTKTKSSANPLDLDNAGFDSKKYLKKMLLEQGVKGLLQADADLITSVRQIDGDMKTMVYENYSKFISATETIGKMKEDADFMDAEMAKLSRRISDISRHTKTVDRGLAQRRERIQQLSSEQKTMQRLQLLFDLPDRLSQLISQGLFVDAAREWSRTRPLLEHYRQLGVFSGVENDGKQIMASVEMTIWNRWRGSDTDVREGAECASLLVLLHPERAADLWREYLEIQGVKNRECRQAALDRAFVSPRAAATDFPALDPLLPLDSNNNNDNNNDKPAAGSGASRIERFNSEYLPVWSSLVIGFASQFVSPAGSGLLDDAAGQDQDQDQTQMQMQMQIQMQMRKSAGGERAMSLLEATTEGTVVGLLSPLADSAQKQSDVQKQQQASKRKSAGPGGLRVVGWQAMSTEDLARAQDAFSQHLQEWCSDYEFIVDSLLDFPDEATTANIRVYLDQLDAFVACVGAYPILARIGGLHGCVYRIATRWHERLIEGALHGVVRDMIERLEFYFDPNIDAPDISTAPPRRSSVSRHQRSLSGKSNTSQGSANNHQRSGSVLSATWSAANADRNMSYNSASGTPQSPLPFHTVSSASGIKTDANGNSSSRGLAHARAVSSAFEALSNVPTQPIVPASLSLSPSLGPYIAGSSPQNQNQNQNQNQSSNQTQQHRLSRASTINITTNARHSHGPISGSSNSRPGTLRRARHQRTHSNAVMDLFDSQDDLPSQPRRSLSLHRASVRRYRPWLVGSVNRNAPLHVFLADIESWLIQQVLERVNPLLESVVQHYLDIEGSQMLDDGESRAILPLQVATKMRQSFIKTLDGCLDTWMSNWMPDAFLFSAMVNPIHGSRAFVEKSIADSSMAQLGMTTVADPVSSLLLARFAVDLELTLTQSIYQLCEHAISVLPEDSAVRQRRSGDQSANSSADASITNLLAAHRPAGEMSNDPLVSSADRLYSITAASVARADSMASAVSNGRRGTLGMRSGNSAALLSMHRAAHSAKWHSVAERLVRHFVMTVGQDISLDYLRIRPYDFGPGSDIHGGSSERVIGDSNQQGSVVSVSEVWLSICQWMRQVEGDTNALFYDPVFSETLKTLDNSSVLHGGSEKPGVQQQQQQQSLAAAGSKGAVAGSMSSISGAYNNPALLHAHILSNIDRLFAERVDVFPKAVAPLSSGQILFHLAMQIIKTALESIRLKPIILHTAAQYQQVLVDATFVRSWMLRYTGIAPDLLHLSEPPQFPQLGQTFVGEPRRRSSRTKLTQGANTGGTAGGTGGGGGGGGGNFQSVSSAAVNERDAQAVQNLIDDWISSAKALALDRTEPDPKIVDRIVLNAWLATYFRNPVENHSVASNSRTE